MKDTLRTALTGEELEKEIEGMPMSQKAKDTLMHMCSRSYQSDTQETVELAYDSESGDRLIKALHKFGLQKAGDLLGYQISISEGSLIVTALQEKAAA